MKLQGVSTLMRHAVQEQSVPSKASLQTQPRTAVTREGALQIMWEYYRDNKSRLHDRVRQHRDAIVAELMAGESAEQAFSGFVKPVGADRRMRLPTDKSVSQPVGAELELTRAVGSAPISH